MDKKLRPIIKWTGGKFNEFALFAHEIPTFERYIEPFFGGGGVFFSLQPKGKALINDKSTDLINFYREIKNPKLQAELLKYAQAWSELTEVNQQMWQNCGVQFSAYMNGKAGLSTLEELFSQYLNLAFEKIEIFNSKSFLIDVQGFKTTVLASMVDKARRIFQICKKEAKRFTEAELANHFETGIRGGTYLFFRSLLNKNFNQHLKLEPTKAAANWYFVREFCYGAMFRFNAKGEFNIPYGGITYNKKNFLQKVQNIFIPALISLFEHTTISNYDFEFFLKDIILSPKDFIFLDPPYDSEFSEYDQSAFTRNDQLRLANFLLKTSAKWMVVIKETPFIREIYNHPAVKIKVFLKNYTYNVRGRNNRNVQHLIITNY